MIIIIDAQDPETRDRLDRRTEEREHQRTKIHRDNEDVETDKYRRRRTKERNCSLSNDWMYFQFKTSQSL